VVLAAEAEEVGKMSLKRLIIFLIIAIAIFISVFFLLQTRQEIISEIKTIEKTEEKAEKEEKINLIDLVSNNALLDVPFVVQAPFGDWDNSMFQDGCEEASILMAMLWIEDGSLDEKEMQDRIIQISNFEQKKYDEYRDRSAKDVVQLIKDYFGYHNVEVKYKINSEDIKQELKKGNLIITPMNGQALRNPFFTLPGPERHMLVIKGYDNQTNEFITNDPGTKRGEDYRYSEKILENAIRDYETGYHIPITELRKAMIVVEWPHKACLGINCFNVELVKTNQERSRGLMFRKELATNWGMIFVFDQKAKHSFWMKNTLIPLDIIWIDENYKVVHIKNNFQPCVDKNCETIAPKRKAKYVLEINGGLAEKIGINVGDRFDFNF